MTALTEDERAAVDHALQSMLSEAEAEYHQRDRSTDYYLFPHGRLVKGIASAERARQAPLGRDGLRKLFHALERAVGITPVPKRGWYGLRRSAADSMANLTPDPDVRNRSAGWAKGSKMGDVVYRDQQDLQKLYSTALMRAVARTGQAPPAESTAQVDLDVLAKLPVEVLRAAIERAGLPKSDDVEAPTDAASEAAEITPAEVASEARVGTRVGTQAKTAGNPAPGGRASR